MSSDLTSVIIIAYTYERGREEKKERKEERGDVPAASAGIGGREGERERDPTDRVVKT